MGWGGGSEREAGRERIDGEWGEVGMMEGVERRERKWPTSDGGEAVS